jgi:hypothetical protein
VCVCVVGLGWLSERVCVSAVCVSAVSCAWCVCRCVSVLVSCPGVEILEKVHAWSIILLDSSFSTFGNAFGIGKSAKKARPRAR